MDVQQLLSKVTDNLTVGRVFGEPIQHGDILIVPVARIRGGAGGGSSLGVAVAQLAKASGIPRPSIEAIERAGTTTRAESHEITVALAWLSNNRVTRALTT